MKLINLSVILLAALGTFSRMPGCVSESQQNNSTLKLASIKISKEEITNASFPYSNLVQDVKFIPLETVAEGQIGNVDKILEYEDKFFILDRFNSTSVLVFDTTGSFLFRIGSIGEGPGEYIIPMDICIDRENRTLLLLDVQNLRMNMYNLDDGVFIESATHDIPANGISKHDEFFAFLVGRRSALLLITDNNLNPLVSRVAFEPKYTTDFYDPLIRVSDSLTLAHLFLNDTIYSFKNGLVEPFLHIDFGEYAVDNKQINFSIEETRGLDFNDYFKEFMIQSSIFYYNQTHTVFAFHHQNERYTALVSNGNQSKVVYPYLNVENDVTFEQFPPIVQGLSQDQTSFLDLLYFHRIQTDRLFKQEDSRFANRIKELIHEGFNENSNPVLIRIKFKETLPKFNF